MGEIRILVDAQGNVSVQTTFDAGVTLHLVGKTHAALVNQPVQFQPAVQVQAAPPGLVGRLNGRG